MGGWHVGRTNPTYRDRLSGIEREWGDYRRALRAAEQPHFDRLFEHGREYAHAAGYRNHPNPEIPLLVSVLLAHQRELATLRDQVDELTRVCDQGDELAAAHERPDDRADQECHDGVHD